MLDQMSPDQFYEWCAKDLIEPIGHAGTHEILSQIAYMLASYLGAKNVTPWTYKFWQTPPQDVDTADAEVAAMALEMMGARRTRG